LALPYPLATPYAPPDNPRTVGSTKAFFPKFAVEMLRLQASGRHEAGRLLTRVVRHF
jgi:hypothetical protein